jgi:hypothetical protein
VRVRLVRTKRLNCTLRTIPRIAQSINKRFRWGAIACFPTPWSLLIPGARPSTGTVRTVCGFLRRKEVIQPQVPLRLPCYDFIPVTSYTLGPCPLAVGAGTSGATGFHDVTGGVYKTRERIHGAVADAPLLAIPTSWRRVAASNPNWARFSRFPPPRGIGSHCAGHCSTCAALGVRAILT